MDCYAFDVLNADTMMHGHRSKATHYFEEQPRKINHAWLLHFLLCDIRKVVNILQHEMRDDDDAGCCVERAVEKIDLKFKLTN
jgi:hypothetical protein